MPGLTDFHITIVIKLAVSSDDEIIDRANPKTRNAHQARWYEVSNKPIGRERESSSTPIMSTKSNFISHLLQSHQ